MRRTIPWLVSLPLVALICCRPATAQAEPPRPIISKPTVKTDRLGGVDIPSAAELKKMHASQYVLHARAGKLTKVPVQKVLLPHDPEANPQAVYLVKAPGGTVYAKLASVICKSTDGGRKWTAYKPARIPESTARVRGGFQVLRDGTFVGVAGGGEPKGPMIVMTSSDEGRSWQKLAEFEIPNKYKPYLGKYAEGLHQLADGTLLCPIDVRMPRQWTALCFRSTDGGKTWHSPSTVCHAWAGAEGGIAETRSGKVLAVIRHQRKLLPTDPPEIIRAARARSGWAYKHVFLADSLDRGRTWQNFRQLATVFGQTRGYPAALSDGTVVVIHDTRYGPGSPGSRAMISRDEGKTWQNEVYYLDFTTFTGSYNASVVLADDLILTVAGSSQAGNSWGAVKDHTDFFSIRWKPVKGIDR